MMKVFLPSLLIPPILLGITYILGSRSLSDRDKLSPFECGFDPMKSARQPFSMRFFLLAVLFLVFDIELVLLLPTIITQTYSNLLFAFLCILLLGLLHEWNEGSLDWKN